MARRYDPEFAQFLREQVTLDPTTGLVKVKNAYAYFGFNITWKGKPKSVTYANLVWFLSRNAWPRDGFHIDHINNDPLDNRPANLQEIPEAENQKKRRGRKVYRNYGSGKYGYGLGIYNDKRDDRYYVNRHLSRGHGDGELKTIRKSLGGFDTLEEAEARIAACIEEIKSNGLDHVPEPISKREKRQTILLDASAHKLRELRLKGHTIQEIADITGFASGSIYKRIKDIDVDRRLMSYAPKRVRSRLIK